MKLIIALFVLIPSLTFANCEFKFESENLCSEIKWLTGPFVGKPSSFELKFFDENDEQRLAKAPNKKVEIYTWMKMDNGHDHGGPGLVITREENIWKIEKARFFGGMSGTWWVRVELQEEGQMIERVEFPVKL